jgi:AcrR family transcriptional regulator
VARSNPGPPTGGGLPPPRPSYPPHRGRGPGRPRSAEAHAAILAATLDLLVEQGFNGLTMESVAARAGVGKATVYRRWPSKVPLVVEALRAAGAERVAVPASGSLEADLRQLLADLMAALSGPASVLPLLVTEAWREPALGEAFRQELVQRRRSVVHQILQQGQKRGELRPDLDLETAVDAVVAVVYYRLLVSGAPLGADLARCLVDQLLRGIGAKR